MVQLYNIIQKKNTLSLSENKDSMACGNFQTVVNFFSAIIVQSSSEE